MQEFKRHKIMLAGSDPLEVRRIAVSLTGEYLVLPSSRGRKSLDLIPLFEPDILILVETSGRPDLADHVDYARAFPAARNIPIILLASQSTAFNNVSGHNIHPLPTVSIPLLRALLRGFLGHPSATRDKVLFT